MQHRFQEDDKCSFLTEAHEASSNSCSPQDHFSNEKDETHKQFLTSSVHQGIELIGVKCAYIPSNCIELTTLDVTFKQNNSENVELSGTNDYNFLAIGYSSDETKTDRVSPKLNNSSVDIGNSVDLSDGSCNDVSRYDEASGVEPDPTKMENDRKSQQIEQFPDDDSSSLNDSKSNHNINLKASNSRADNEDTDQKSANKITFNHKDKELIRDVSLETRQSLFFDVGLVNALETIKELLLLMQNGKPDENCTDSSLSDILLELVQKADDTKIISIQEQLPFNATAKHDDDVENKNTANEVQNIVSSDSIISSTSSETDVKDMEGNDERLHQRFENDEETNNVKNTIVPSVFSSSSVSTDLDSNDEIMKDAQLGQGLDNLLENAKLFMLNMKTSTKNVTKSDKEINHELKDVDHSATLSSSIPTEKDSISTRKEDEKVDQEQDSVPETELLSSSIQTEDNLKKTAEINGQKNEVRENTIQSDPLSSSVSTSVDPNDVIKKDEQLGQGLDNLLANATLFMLNIKSNTKTTSRKDKETNHGLNGVHRSATFSSASPTVNDSISTITKDEQFDREQDDVPQSESLSSSTLTIDNSKNTTEMDDQKNEVSANIIQADSLSPSVSPELNSNNVTKKDELLNQGFDNVLQNASLLMLNPNATTKKDK